MNEDTTGPAGAAARVAPPDKAAGILRGMGYPVNAKLLRRLYKAGQLPGTFTGKRVLIPIAKAVELLENGTPTPERAGVIRRVEG
jgi:hypothetical protein